MNKTKVSKPLKALPVPRAGLDRILCSAVPASPGYPYFRTAKDFPTVFGSYIRSQDRHFLKPSGYDCFLKYRHQTDPQAPILRVFYRPWRERMPLFRVSICATMARLLNLDELEALVHEFRVATAACLPVPIPPLPLKPSEVELTIDLPPDVITAKALYRQCFASRTEKALWIDNHDWGVQGSRHSPTSIRMYDKVEAGLQATRLEWVVRRPRLRRWHVQTVADLDTIPWAQRFRRACTFVDFQRSRQASGRTQWAFQAQVRHRGVKGAVRHVARPHRQWLRRRYRPTPIQAVIEAALMSWQQTHQPTPPAP